MLDLDRLLLRPSKYRRNNQRLTERRSPGQDAARNLAIARRVLLLASRNGKVIFPSWPGAQRRNLLPARAKRRAACNDFPRYALAGITDIGPGVNLRRALLEAHVRASFFSSALFYRRPGSRNRHGVRQTAWAHQVDQPLTQRR